MKSRRALSALLVCVVLANCIITCVLLLLRQQFSDSTVSVKKFISAQNGDLGIERIITLTELSDEYDLVFYYTSDNCIAANILVKNENGKYVGLVMTTAQAPDHINYISASSRLSYLSEYTLYWGIAQSPKWTIDHPDSHQIIVDDLTLGYYLHNKPLDEETLDLKFVYTKN